MCDTAISQQAQDNQEAEPSSQDEYLEPSTHQHDSKSNENHTNENPTDDDKDYDHKEPRSNIVRSVYTGVAHKGYFAVERTPRKHAVARTSGFLANTTPRRYASTRSGRIALNRTPRKEAKKRPLQKLGVKKSLMTKLSFPSPLSSYRLAKIPERNTTAPYSNAQDLLATFALIVEEMWSISGATLRNLKTPIAWGLVGFLGFVLFGFVLSTVRNALQPICIIPGISGSVLCLPLKSDILVPSKAEPKQADYSTMVDIQSQMFEHLLEAATGGSALSLEMKKAEIATKDLAVQVRISDLRSKDIIAAALTQFAADALTTGRGLQKLAAKVGGAVDNVLAVNEYVLQSIEEARATEPAAWSLTAVSPWRCRQTLEITVAVTFNEAMNILSANMQRLIAEAEYSRANLMNLEDRLTALHEIVSRDDLSISKEKTDLLAQLWTKLGGNREPLQSFDSHLDLLRGLTAYRKQALIHVVGALETLYAMSEDMEDLQARVTLSDSLEPPVPVEVHMKSIQWGMERLQEGRTRTRKLGIRSLSQERSLL